MNFSCLIFNIKNHSKYTKKLSLFLMYYVYSNRILQVLQYHINSFRHIFILLKNNYLNLSFSCSTIYRNKTYFSSFPLLSAIIHAIAAIMTNRNKRVLPLIPPKLIPFQPSNSKPPALTKINTEAIINMIANICP